VEAVYVKALSGPPLSKVVLIVIGYGTPKTPTYYIKYVIRFTFDEPFS
jgi:hypothetical protein